MAHKHAHMIRAWADGAQIQVFAKRWKRWKDTDKPTWDEDSEYRIKPEEHSVWDMRVVYERDEVVAKMSGRPNLRLTFHTTTNQLIEATVLR